MSLASLLELVSQGRIDAKPLVTHRFALGDVMDAYDEFSRPQETGALKVVLTHA